MGWNCWGTISHEDDYSEYNVGLLPSSAVRLWEKLLQIDVFVVFTLVGSPDADWKSAPKDGGSLDASTIEGRW